MKTTMRTEEGKYFTLVLEHKMDMKENLFHNVRKSIEKTQRRRNPRKGEMCLEKKKSKK